MQESMGGKKKIIIMGSISIFFFEKLKRNKIRQNQIDER